MSFKTFNLLQNQVALNPANTVFVSDGKCRKEFNITSGMSFGSTYHLIKFF